MPRRVLLVDDNLAVQKLVELTLRKEGFEITSVDNALSALDLALKNRPDVILADYNLEGMNIFAFVRKLRQKERLAEIPVVLLINSSESYDPTQLQTVGIQASLRKPIDSRELTQEVKKQTGTAETVVMDLNTLHKGESTLSEHFSNPGVDTVKIEELLGWSSPGIVLPDPNLQPKTGQALEPPPPHADPTEALEETQYLKEGILKPQPPLETESKGAPDEGMEETHFLQMPIEKAALASPQPTSSDVEHATLPPPNPALPVSAFPGQENSLSSLLDPEPNRNLPPAFPPAEEMEANISPSPAPAINRIEMEEAVRKNVLEAVEKVVSEALPSIVESALTKEVLTGIVEQVVWDVVPSIAEIEIKKEIKRLQAEDESLHP